MSAESKKTDAGVPMPFVIFYNNLDMLSQLVASSCKLSRDMLEGLRRAESVAIAAIPDDLGQRVTTTMTESVAPTAPTDTAVARQSPVSATTPAPATTAPATAPATTVVAEPAPAPVGATISHGMIPATPDVAAATTIVASAMNDAASRALAAITGDVEAVATTTAKSTSTPVPPAPVVTTSPASGAAKKN